MQSKNKIIDLSHALSSEIPSWSGDCGFNLEIESDYKDCSGPDFFRTNKISTMAGMGTHIDAPAHCFSGAATIDQMQLESLVTDCVVIKLDHVADQNFIITPEVISEFERQHGLIQPNSFVIFNTGWARYWGEAKKYRNDLQFPSLAESTAKLLLERRIHGLGTDTLSADAQGKSFPVHRAILGAGKYLVENIADASNVPATGARIIIAPTKLKDATEAPVRLIAFV